LDLPPQARNQYPVQEGRVRHGALILRFVWETAKRRGKRYKGVDGDIIRRAATARRGSPKQGLVPGRVPGQSVRQKLVGFAGSDESDPRIRLKERVSERDKSPGIVVRHGMADLPVSV